MEAAIIEAGLILIPKIVELIKSAKEASAEKHAEIMSRLKAMDAALLVDAEEAHESFKREGDETRRELANATKPPTDSSEK